MTVDRLMGQGSTGTLYFPLSAVSLELLSEIKPVFTKHTGAPVPLLQSPWDAQALEGQSWWNSRGSTAVHSAQLCCLPSVPGTPSGVLPRCSHVFPRPLGLTLLCAQLTAASPALLTQPTLPLIRFLLSSPHREQGYLGAFIIHLIVTEHLLLLGTDAGTGTKRLAKQILCPWGLTPPGDSTRPWRTEKWVPV